MEGLGLQSTTTTTSSTSTDTEMTATSATAPPPSFLSGAELALHQHVLQMKQQQLLQQQLLEHQFQRNRQLLQAQHERQLAQMLRQQQEQQEQQQRLEEEQRRRHQQQEQVAKTLRQPDQQQARRSELDDRRRLDELKSKRQQEQSAVASPEVKRHLQEFVLQKKRKEAAASMVNLKMGNNAFKSVNNNNNNNNNVRMKPSSATLALLRKTASESNLLKMKNRRHSSASAGKTKAPYPQPPSIPEEELDLPKNNRRHNRHLIKSHSASPPIELTSPSTTPNSPNQNLSRANFSNSQAPLQVLLLTTNNSTKTSSTAEPLSLQTSSRSLPNIVSAVLVRPTIAAKPVSMDESMATTHSASSEALGPEQQRHLLVRRSKSSAILPLRKHLMEKALHQQERARTLSMDEEQFYRQQKQIARDRIAIRPIEEVLEPENEHRPMEVDSDEPSPSSSDQVANLAARLGPAGLSPLVLADVLKMGDSVSRLLPQQPLDLMLVSKSNSAMSNTGLGFDPVMLRHECTCRSSQRHPEHPGRLQAIWSRLVSSGLASRCVRVWRKASLDEVRSLHTSSLVYASQAVQEESRSTSVVQPSLSKLCRLECGGVGVDADTYWNENETPLASLVAVGTVLELASKVVRGELKNGFALVRPPGHHAEAEEAMGFCYLNNVAIAAHQMLARGLAKRILILDWAIHHGNGTQKAFYEDRRVLYISLHRHDDGNFYPGTGGPLECGQDAGLGFNMNIAWNGGLDPPMGDAEYLAAFRSLVLPVATEFEPDLVLVSAGFDAALGHAHPMGGYTVSTACFAYLTLQLQQLAQGKLVLVLEGGYQLDVLAEACEQCLRALMGVPIIKIEESELARRPCDNAVQVINTARSIQSAFWSCLRSEQSDSAQLSHLDSWERRRGDSENAVTAMAGLTVDGNEQIDDKV